MDKIELLQERKAKFTEVYKELRERIDSVCDDESFVELSAFSFSKNDFYGTTAEGEGVLTGFATVNGYPFYIVGQNFKVLSGGVSEANCNKIAKCLDLAEKNATPVIYFLSSLGVQVGEGVSVLEGLGKILMRATQLKGVVPQYAIVNGEVYGSVAMLAAIADFTFFIDKKSVLSVNSPLVLSAKSGKNLAKEDVGGANALANTGIPTFTVKDFDEIKTKINDLSEIFDMPQIDAELNDTFPALNSCVSAESVLEIFENPIELNKGYQDEVKTVLGRIGGIAVSAVIFDGKEDGVELTEAVIEKIRTFTELSACYSLPIVFFTDTKGIKPCTCVNASRVMKETAEFLNMLDTIDTPKISVVYKKAIGLGYSLFASKGAGFDYTCAFANAKIALFDSVQGAEIEFGNEKGDKSKLAEKYADENSDPVNAAKNGYIDAIIEPEFVKQYLVASLQMLAR